MQSMVLKQVHQKGIDLAMLFNKGKIFEGICRKGYREMGLASGFFERKVPLVEMGAILNPKHPGRKGRLQALVDQLLQGTISDQNKT